MVSERQIPYTNKMLILAVNGERIAFCQTQLNPELEGRASYQEFARVRTIGDSPAFPNLILMDWPMVINLYHCMEKVTIFGFLRHCLFALSPPVSSTYTFRPQFLFTSGPRLETSYTFPSLSPP
jgi:hypothetical protein